MNIKKQNFFLAGLLIVELLLGCWHPCFAMHQVPCQKCNGLFDAIMSGDLEKVEILLNTPGLDLNGSWLNGLTPLHQACSYCFPPRIVELLLNRGAHVNRLDLSGRTPLHLAARYGSLATVKLLLERGADLFIQDSFGETPLLCARYNRNADAIKILINEYMIHRLCSTSEVHSSMGASCSEKQKEACRVTKKGLHITRRQRSAVDAPSPSTAAAAMQQSTAAQSSVAASSSYQIPSRCVQSEISERAALEQLRLDLEKGVVVDCYGCTKLHKAVCNNHQSVVHFLLARGAAVNLQDEQGVMPLHYAVKFGRLGIIQILLSHGAEINIQDRTGDTPLHYCASFCCHPEVIHFLLLRGAKVSIQNQCGDTPLHCAAREGNIAAVQIFLNCGACADQQNSYESTPLFEAVACNQPEIVKLLLKHGADISLSKIFSPKPLDLAVKSGFKEVARIIQDHIECSEIKCPICLRYTREFGSSERAQTPCCHQFICLSDLRNVRAHNHSCPLCRERKGWE
ncbi:MAG TPA: ankyrin repeat domain-containing protein [Candidatus Dependentiae bacterium]|nr:ankyrin repeat domain-containing protein [Candidatus Dependentiae bacterium]